MELKTTEKLEMELEILKFVPSLTWSMTLHYAIDALKL